MRPLCACTHPDGYDAAQLARIAAAHGVPPLLARALVRRGLTDDAAIDAFLHPTPDGLPDPLALPDMAAAVARLRAAIGSGERICVYGDYDADGVCATAILIDCLRAAGADAIYYLPSRHGEGYGLHEAALRDIAGKGVRLVVTVDTGINALEQARACRALGMDLIVTDHHLPGAELPDACAVVAQARPGLPAPEAGLCGAGVAFQLSRALDPEGPYQKRLALAAVATVADVVPLRGSNRAIVALGLRELDRVAGLRALLDCAGQGDRPVSGETAAFLLAPRLNAAGRMGGADRAVELLLAGTEAEAAPLAAWLDGQNAARRAQEQRILDDIAARCPEGAFADRRAIVLCGEDWHLGVIGIVAARLVERYHRPALLFGLHNGLITGSCRSIPGIDLHACLSAFSGRFERFGGHALAAGVTMRPEAFDAFAADFDAYLREHFDAETFEPVAWYEEDVSLSELTVDAVDALQALGPFGEGNPEPVFRLTRAEASGVRQIGREGAHLSLTVEQGGGALRAVGFGFGARAAEFGGARRWTLLCTPQRSDFRGQSRVELRLSAAFPADAAKVFRAFLAKALYNTDVDCDKLCKVFAVTHGFSPFAALSLAPDALRRRYVRLRGLTEGGAAADSLLALDAADDLFACCVFLELGFFAPDAARALVAPVQRPAQRTLEESALYRSAVRAQQKQ